jgi:hypothetical protein
MSISRVFWVVIGVSYLALSACGETNNLDAPTTDAGSVDVTVIVETSDTTGLDGYPYSSNECLCSVSHVLPEPPIVYVDASATVATAARLFEEGRFNDSLSKFEEVINQGGVLAQDYFNRGAARMNVMLLEEALTDFTRAVELDPSFSPAHLNLGIVHYRNSDDEMALKSITAAIDNAPGYALAYWNRGHILGMRTEYESGLAAFNMAVKIDPDNPVNLMGRGIAYANMDRIGEARADFEAALALTDDPSVIVPIEIALRDMSDGAVSD